MAVRTRRPRPDGRPAHRYRRRRPWLVVGALALAVVTAVAFLLLRGSAGPLAAAQTRHDFGRVPIDGGIVNARFPLTATTPVRIIDLGTT